MPSEGGLGESRKVRIRRTNEQCRVLDVDHEPTFLSAQPIDAMDSQPFPLA